MPPGRQGCLRSIQRGSRDLWVAWLRDHVPTNVLSVFWPPLAWHSPTLRGTCLEKAPPGYGRASKPGSVCRQPPHTGSPHRSMPKAGWKPREETSSSSDPDG